MKTVQEILSEQRKTRTADMEIALQDFLELPQHEQTEMLFIGLLQTVSQVGWLVGQLKRRI